MILPAYNEEMTIAETIRAFHEQLPESEIWVINNNSSDNTENIAKETLKNLHAKGGVTTEKRQGKGYAVRRAFMDIDADIYVLSDADLTYPASQIHELLSPIQNGKADMVVGDRQSGGQYQKENKRPLHNFGNRLVQFLVNHLFDAQLTDIMSGYRVFNKIFVKNYPILVDGFEIETDMTLHALDKRFRIIEIPINYKDRPEGSFSKLNTFRDGFRVLGTISKIFRYYKPLFFFSLVAILSGTLGLAAAIPVFTDYITKGFIYHIPLAILATGLELVALIMIAVGLILDANAYYNKSNFERNLLKK